MKKKQIIRILILILIIIALIIIGQVLFNKYMKYKLKKILVKNDSTNYELIEKYNNQEENVKLRNNILISENDNECIWIDGLNGKRVIMDKKSKIAIVTENDEELSVHSLNYTYLKDYFENSNRKFRYLGKEEKFYKFKFEDKKTGVITIFYLNRDNRNY